MKTRILTALLVGLTVHLFAQTEAAGGTSGASPFSNLLFAVLPFVVLGGLLFWFLRKLQTGPRAQQTEQYLLRHQQHMEHVERSLERIASALERKHKDAP